MAISAPVVGVIYEVGNVSYSSIYQGILRLRVNSQNITDNTSNITLWWIYKKLSDDPYGAYNVSGTSYVRLWANGGNWEKQADFDLRSAATGTEVILFEQTFTVSHDSNGSKSISVAGSHETGISFGIKSVGDTDVTLPTIPRASSITNVTASVPLNGTSVATLNISRKSTEFHHYVVWKVGNQTLSQDSVGTSTTTTFPKSWCNQLPNSTSGTGSVTVYTFKGSVQIGSPVSKTFVVTVPSDVVPSIGSLGISRIDNTVPTSWGIYVRTKSKAKLTINSPLGSYGSTIKSYNITGGGYSGTTSTLTTGTLNISGSNTFTAKVTDSRGRTATVTTSITVYDYDSPIITNCTTRRCSSSGAASDEGTYLYVNVTGTRSSCNGKNILSLSVRYRVVDGTWGSSTSLTSGTALIIGAGSIDINKSYEIEITISDSFSSWKYYPPNIPTAFSTFDLMAGGKGITFGGVAEENGFIVKMLSKFTKSITLIGDNTGTNQSNPLIITKTQNGSYGARIDLFNDNLRVWGRLDDGTYTIPLQINFADKNFDISSAYALKANGGMTIPNGKFLDGNIRNEVLFDGSFTTTSSYISLVGAMKYSFIIVYAIVSGTTISSMVVPISAIGTKSSYWSISKSTDLRNFMLTQPSSTSSNITMQNGSAPGIGTIYSVIGIG